MAGAAFVESAIEDYVGVVKLNRPIARNALCSQLTAELTHALNELEASASVNVILLAGTGHHFAAGADVKEMLAMTLDQVMKADFDGCCRRLGTVAKPVVAAVDGFALGGGCELVEMCDVVIASERAVFGHPEIRVGTMPGAGGTQRLPKAIGKHAAMDVLLTGRHLSADEAYRFGLVSRVVGAAELQEQAFNVARQIAQHSGPVTRMIKQAVKHGLNEHDNAGHMLERKLFQLTFALEDRQEGMAAFVERRRPAFRHR